MRARAGRGKPAPGESIDDDTGEVEESVAGESVPIEALARSRTCVSSSEGSNRVRRKSKKSICLSDGEKEIKIVDLSLLVDRDAGRYVRSLTWNEKQR